MKNTEMKFENLNKIKENIMKKYPQLTEDYHKAKNDNFLVYTEYDITAKRAVVETKGYRGRMYTFLYWEPEMGSIENALNLEDVRDELNYFYQIENEEEKRKEAKEFLEKYTKNMDTILAYLDTRNRILVEGIIEDYKQ